MFHVEHFLLLQGIQPQESRRISNAASPRQKSVGEKKKTGRSSRPVEG